ncbi:carbon-nitrogen hydrolase family protein [Marinicauda salina]|nr:carbon-nitrogen hydrolase family protein [Marinicauda salina]
MPRLAIAQHACAPDIDANVKTAERMIAEAGDQGAALVVFPEIHLSPFFPKTKGGDASAWAMTADHPALAALSDAAKAAGVVVVSNVYLEDVDGRRHDASPVFDADGTLLGVSRMNRIAQFDGFWEQDYYAPADGFDVYDTAAGRLGVVICYDRHFPESYRACAKLGAEIIATPTCVEAAEPLDLFEAEMRTLAYHNHVYALLANRCGSEDERAYAGRSLICGPDGSVLARAGDDPEILLAEYGRAARRKTAEARGFVSEAVS